jgi:hypothetical protein
MLGEQGNALSFIQLPELLVITLTQVYAEEEGEWIKVGNGSAAMDGLNALASALLLNIPMGEDGQSLGTTVDAMFGEILAAYVNNAGGRLVDRGIVFSGSAA